MAHRTMAGNSGGGAGGAKSSTGYSAVLIAAGNMTGTNIITSPGVYVGQGNTVSFQDIWTGNPVSAAQGFTFDYSNDPVTDPALVTHWSRLSVPASWYPDSNPVGVAGDSGFGFIDYEYAFIRQNYENASGNGTLLTLVAVKP
jgi:hypothetical protein